MKIVKIICAHPVLEGILKLFFLYVTQWYTCRKLPTPDFRLLVRQLDWFCFGLFKFSVLFSFVLAVLSYACSFVNDVITLFKECIP
jgi:hypothetical protein